MYAEREKRAVVRSLAPEALGPTRWGERRGPTAQKVASHRPVGYWGSASDH